MTKCTKMHFVTLHIAHTSKLQPQSLIFQVPINGLRSGEVAKCNCTMQLPHFLPNLVYIFDFLNFN